MSSPGYIYVLINPSFNELVKIGKTQRELEERIKELSSATGVPTPFVLAYKAYFQDCTKAEVFIHSKLIEKDYQVTDNREFFRAPLHEVIEIILIAREALEGTEPLSLDKNDESIVVVSPTLMVDDPSPIEPCQAFYELANDFYYGRDDTIEDHKEALKLYVKATNLGCIHAYLQIGNIYSVGKGVRKNYSKALDYFKEGVQKGDHRCWAEMALLFSTLNKYENMRKCWNKYFESEHYQLDITYGDSIHNKIFYATHYLIKILPLTKKKYLNFEIEHKDKLYPIREEMIEQLNKVIDKGSKFMPPAFIKEYYMSVLKEVEGWN
jgi:hypothetical protein